MNLKIKQQRGGMLNYVDLVFQSEKFCQVRWFRQTSNHLKLLHSEVPNRISVQGDPNFEVKLLKIGDLWMSKLKMIGKSLAREFDGVISSGEGAFHYKITIKLDPWTPRDSGVQNILSYSWLIVPPPIVKIKKNEKLILTCAVLSVEGDTAYTDELRLSRRIKTSVHSNDITFLHDNQSSKNNWMLKKGGNYLFKEEKKQFFSVHKDTEDRVEINDGVLLIGKMLTIDSNEINQPTNQNSPGQKKVIYQIGMTALQAERGLTSTYECSFLRKKDIFNYLVKVIVEEEEEETQEENKKREKRNIKSNFLKNKKNYNKDLTTKYEIQNIKINKSIIQMPITNIIVDNILTNNKKNKLFNINHENKYEIKNNKNNNKIFTNKNNYDFVQNKVENNDDNNINYYNSNKNNKNNNNINFNDYNNNKNSNTIDKNNKINNYIENNKDKKNEVIKRKIDKEIGLELISCEEGNLKENVLLLRERFSTCLRCRVKKEEKFKVMSKKRIIKIDDNKNYNEKNNSNKDNNNNTNNINIINNKNNTNSIITTTTTTNNKNKKLNINNINNNNYDYNIDNFNGQPDYEVAFFKGKVNLEIFYSNNYLNKKYKRNMDNNNKNINNNNYYKRNTDIKIHNNENINSNKNEKIVKRNNKYFNNKKKNMKVKRNYLKDNRNFFPLHFYNTHNNFSSFSSFSSPSSLPFFSSSPVFYYPGNNDHMIRMNKLISPVEEEEEKEEDEEEMSEDEEEEENENFKTINHLNDDDDDIRINDEKWEEEKKNNQKEHKTELKEDSNKKKEKNLKKYNLLLDCIHKKNYCIGYQKYVNVGEGGFKEVSLTIHRALSSQWENNKNTKEKSSFLNYDIKNIYNNNTYNANNNYDDFNNYYFCKGFNSTHENFIAFKITFIQN